MPPTNSNTFLDQNGNMRTEYDSGSGSIPDSMPYMRPGRRATRITPDFFDGTEMMLRQHERHQEEARARALEEETRRVTENARFKDLMRSEHWREIFEKTVQTILGAQAGAILNQPQIMSASIPPGIVKLAKSIVLEMAKEMEGTQAEAVRAAYADFGG